MDIFQTEPENWTDYVKNEHMHSIDVLNMLKDQEKDKKKLKDKKV